jgi:uncharacterized protein (DUF1330 family)
VSVSAEIVPAQDIHGRAFVIIDSNVRDREQYLLAQPRGMSALAQTGGQFIARAREPLVLEGRWSPSRVSIIEFRNFADAKRWYGSPDYQAAKSIREQAADMCIVAI